MRVPFNFVFLLAFGATMGSPAFADIPNPEDTSQSSEEEEESTDNEGQSGGSSDNVRDPGCASVGTEASVFMALFPVAGLGLLALYRRKP